MKGSEDWLLGWNDHDKFIEPFRRSGEALYFMLGFGMGLLLAVALI